jgi:fructose-bisphosphate aldolase class II
MVTGAVALAEFANVVAEELPGQHRPAHRPLPEAESSTASCARCVAISIERVKAGKVPLFQSHMWDGSAVPLEENLDIAEEMLDKCHVRPTSSSRSRSASSVAKRTASRPRDQRQALLHPEDGLATAEALGLGEKGRYMVAATFGNVHGVYKPGNVKLRPEHPQGDPGRRRRQVRPVTKPFDLVFHGGSGSLPRRSARPSTTAW